MSHPGARYVPEDDGGEGDRSMRVCAEAGRKCVRNIQLYPVLSAEWIALVDSLKQLARLVQLEGRMPGDPKVSDIQGRASGSGTLWDQEGHENAVRILVEEAKVNLCLRMMREFKAWQYDPAARQQRMQEASAAYGLTEAQLDSKCRTFEESLGLLLWKAFQHVETLQLMDIPLLLDYLAEVLGWMITARTADTPPAPGKVQETLVTHYFSSLMKHAEALNNSELLARARERGLLHAETDHLLNDRSECQEEVLLEAAIGYSALADNEDFRTQSVWQSFFTDEYGRPDHVKKDLFLQLEERMLGKVLEADPDKKRDLRPLIDFFKQVRLRLG